MLIDCGPVKDCRFAVTHRVSPQSSIDCQRSDAKAFTFPLYAWPVSPLSLSNLYEMARHNTNGKVIRYASEQLPVTEYWPISDSFLSFLFLVDGPVNSVRTGSCYA